MIMKPLSPYTIVSNCTDSTDLRDGINEIRDRVKCYEMMGKRVPSYFFLRLSKLINKLENIEKND